MHNLNTFLQYYDRMLIMRILLASSSPRRIELLKTLGFDLLIIAPDLDETVLEGETAEQMVCRLAKQKARTVWNKGPKNLPIVAADTTICVDKHILGKPEDKDDAFRMLKMLSGNTHDVITGYAVKKNQTEEIGLVKTKVTFRELTDEEILSYVETGEPLNKAGAYAIQGAGASLIENITGCISNVIGLPITEVLASLSSIEMQNQQKVHNKLVRNRIPEILEKKGIQPITKILDENSFNHSLNDKLQEEVQEFLLASSKETKLEELADILEVILAILHSENTTFDHLESLRLKKMKERGDFSKKIFLEKTLTKVLCE